jgi:hypothetical protein
MLKRRTFLISIMACFVLPVSLFSKDKNGSDLVFKNGWIFKKGDF